MAKHLKLKVKNTQLAEALKIGKLKKAKAVAKADISETPENAVPKAEKKLTHGVPKAKPAPDQELTPPAIEEEATVAAPEEEVVEPVVKGHSTLVKARSESFVPPKHFQKQKKAETPEKKPKTEKKTKTEPKQETTAPLPKEKKPLSFKEYRDIKPKKTQPQGAFDSRARQGLSDQDDGRWRKRRPYHRTKQRVSAEEIIRPSELKIRLPIVLKDLAQAMKIKTSELISKLFMQGVVMTINDYLDDETTVQLLGHEFGCEISIDSSEEERLRVTDKTIREEIAETPEDQLQSRPPVVTFMGHVDHGKTSLIDAIRKTNITAKEAGAITQHIGAFKCHTAVGDLTILDTPGHEAFTAMRSRGAEVTDIVVLVIAGDEGMRPQTIEAIQQTKEAGVPIVVAINKCDKPSFNAENVYRQLSEQELLPEAWGGTTITVNCSAISKDGIKELLEMLALQTEVLELKANPKMRARGSVIESQMHKGLGAVATLLIQNGTLNLGDAVVFDEYWGRIKTMHDEFGKNISHAPPSYPVKVTGLSSLPEAGNEFIVVANEKEAKKISSDRREQLQHKELYQSKRNLEILLQQKAEVAKKKILNVILRTDVQGSLEALKNTLKQIPSTKIEINFISSEVGEISESDVERASASNAIILGFHSKVEPRAEPLVKQLKIKVILHDVIYHVVDDVRAIMLSMLDKIAQENEIGKAHVKATFKSSRLGLIAGCQVDEGKITRNARIRLLRNGEEIWKGEILSIKRDQNEVNEASKGMECGLLFKGFSTPQVGDLLEAFEITYIAQTLED